MTRDAATEWQVQAADPGLSTWLSANAGSGKTRVLTDRVARLLLQDVEPQRILCLTYTTAAASEMQNRLFRRLGEWAMLESGALCEKLQQLGLDEAPTDATLRKARRLFARAIETPGGLKIQTIHSFCASLLRRFPLEAGVSPQFVEMDDRAARRLRDEIVEDLADGPIPDAFDGVARWYTGEDLAKLTEEIAKHRRAFANVPDSRVIWPLFDLPPGSTLDDALNMARPDPAFVRRAIPILRAGLQTDQKVADAFGALRLNGPSLHDLLLLEDVLLTKANANVPFSAKTGSVPTKKTRADHPDLAEAMDALMQQVEAARVCRVRIESVHKTLALHQFAATFLPEYEARKTRHGWLDFDDLIFKARDLLADSSVAEWVLYRLDGGIDHILVDEAQDTSPVQWQVIDLLAHEFTSGQGARANEARTIFVVGDKKQSIYSFQGADPDEFDRMRAHFGTRLSDAQLPLQDLELEYSFRSAEAVLRTVDNTFHEAARRGLGKTISHRAFRTEMPGRVDLWPVMEDSESEAPPHWTDPVDTLAPAHHLVRLAEKVASEIRRIIDTGETLLREKDGKPFRKRISPGDFLILVQRRSELFHEIIRACKAAGLAIAGADRLKIGGELAVKDITALLAFLATPEDSLSLAAALRSPLFGWSEARLYDLAAGRDETYLWQTLRNRSSAETETYFILSGLLDDADFLRPYDLIERILIRYDGRRKLTARLGEDAEDGIDAMLSQALAYERMEVPSLTGFLSWLESGEVEIKRQMDSAGDRIRVMTVHGAKGLEAPIVILPDTARRDIQIKDEIYTGPGDVPLWRTDKDNSTTAMTAARAALLEKQEDERERLLYVAMTRAESWLIACAAGKLANGASWYERIRDGMERSGALPHDFGFGPGLRLENGAWNTGEVETGTVSPGAPASLPDWATTPAKPPLKPPPLVSPSDLGGGKVLGDTGDAAGLNEEAAKHRGRLIHLLLEHLPPLDRTAWVAAANALLQGLADQALISDVFAETEAVITSSALAALFTPDAMAEVDITADLTGVGLGRIYGTIDRLIVSGAKVLLVDYKSNAVVAKRADDVPLGLLRQMGAYVVALAQVYPEHEIETAILWTRNAQLMPLPSQLVASALERKTTS